MGRKLLRTRRFGPLFWTQLLGAFNDNLFKNAVVVLLAFGTASAEEADTWVNLAAGLFILPFFLFSAPAGLLADKLEKSRLVRVIKGAEVAIMGLGAVALVLGSAPGMLAVLFLMGLQSALFGPVKYSVLPQHLRKDELVAANGLVEMGTFGAILIGTLAGGLAVGLGPGGRWLVAVAMVVVALAGWIASRRIPDAAPNEPGLRLSFNPWRPTVEAVRMARRDRSVFLSILGISWFWFYGAVMLAQLPGYARDVLGGGETVVTVLLAAFSIGIGVGSVLCDRLSGGRIELGLVPVGALGMTLFAMDLFLGSAGGGGPGLGPASMLASLPHLRVLADLVGIGIAGGLYIVPLYALVQHRTDSRHRARVIAANNILNALFMVGAAALAIGLRNLGLDTLQLFLVVAVLNAAVAIHIFTLVPEFLLRFVCWVLMRATYRIRLRGMEHIPEKGAAVLVCNHVSFVDALVIAAVSPRPIRFVMHHRVFGVPGLRLLFRTAGAIPIAPRHEDPELLEQAFDRIAQALEAGELVCLFPEGRLTTDGAMAPFRSGVERIVARTPVPVVPLALAGLWGSFFSRKGGRPMRRPFCRGLRSTVAIACGVPVPPGEVSREALFERVALLHRTAPVAERV